ncbi:hypothetical protein EJ08DRAFT_674448 [Tothia fuscella]|uniref:Uncharacterized protein n=1 Tax=Tothia fuscella TaxID=1048955 RepID=A0A9P4P3F0_9PEZI|nr:hypothetical protein EJ08DRAFT_674448 [Tothia fuscella]
MSDKSPIKGKGKAIESQDETSSLGGNSENKKSLSSRIVSSASNLAKDVVGSSNGHVPSMLASSAALGSKPHSGMQSGPTAWSDTASVRPGPSTNMHGTGQPDLSAVEAFRTQDGHSSSTVDFEKFMTGYTVTGESVKKDQADSSSWTQDFRSQNTKIDHPQGRGSSVGKSLQHDFLNSNETDEFDDGAEVRLLLSDPAFNALTDTFDIPSMQEPSDSVVNDLFPQMFTEEEQRVVDHMRSTLPAPPVHGVIPASHPLNLRPRSDEEKESLQQEMHDFNSHLSDEQARTSFSNDSERDEWVDAWDSVLNGYTDEVWGDLLPVVQEAKTQLEEVRAGASTVDSTAVARLKMILGHVSER